MKPHLFLCVGLLIAAATLRAEERPRVSPHETVKATIGGNEVSVTYGRPYTKDPKSGEPRKIWCGLVPTGQVWRMGADEATVLTTKSAIEIGGKKLDAGSYSLFLLPEEKGAKLIVNKQSGQWGTKHDAAQDVAQIEMQMSEVEQPVDQFTIAIAEAKDGGVLKLTWEKKQFTVPFTVAK